MLKALNVEIIAANSSGTKKADEGVGCYTLKEGRADVIVYRTWNW
jgi:hypothetical protein